MLHSSHKSLLLRAVIFSSIVILFASATSAQRQRRRPGMDAAKFKPGDKVEIREGRDWAPGVVKSINNFGLVEVRVDEEAMKEQLAHVPASFRERMLTRTVPADWVRLVEAAKKEPAPAKNTRLWKDRTGKFNVTATFEGIKNGKAVLVTKEGKRIEVDLEKLSEEDAKFAREAAESQKKETAADPNDPFGDGFSGLPGRSRDFPGRSSGFPGRSRTSNRNSEPDPAPVTGPVRKPNLRYVKNLDPETFSKWTFEPQSTPASEVTVGKPVALTSAAKSRGSFEKILGTYVAKSGARAFIVREQRGRDDLVSCDVLDTAEGKVLGTVDIPVKRKFLDLDPDGELVAYCPDEFGRGDATMLTIAKIDGGSLTPIINFEPFKDDRWDNVDDAKFLGPERIMTRSGLGKKMVLWEIETAKALTNIPVDHMADYWVNSDRRYIMIMMATGIAIIDAKAGKHVATVPAEKEPFAKVIMSADNRRLAMTSNSGVKTWDLTTGEPLGTFWHNTLGVNPKVIWAGEFLLAQNKYLYDPARRVLLWEYHGLSREVANACWQDGLLWAPFQPDRDDTPVFTAYKIPHDTAIETAEQLGTPDDILVAKPGDPVTIQVDVDSGTGSEQNIGRAIATNLEEAGFRPSERAELMVRAVCRKKPRQTIRINTGRGSRFHADPSDIVEKTITPHSASLSLHFRGEKIWQKGHVASPGMTIFLNEGESLDQALNRLTKPNLDLLTKSKFSSYIAKPGKASPDGAYGVSEVTSSAIVDKVGAGGRFE